MEIIVQFSLAIILSLLAIASTARSVAVGHPSPPSLPNGHGKDGKTWKDRIKNVVVLVQENRCFDTVAGGLTYNNQIDGLLQRAYCNPINVTEPYSQAYCAQPIAANIAFDDPNHALSGVNFQVLGTYHPNESAVDEGLEKITVMGFLAEQMNTYDTANVTRAAESMNHYTPDHIPVFSSMAENFWLFDRWFAAIPGLTNSNRAYITSGTSHGWGSDANFGVSVPALPQK